MPPPRILPCHCCHRAYRTLSVTSSQWRFGHCGAFGTRTVPWRSPCSTRQLLLLARHIRPLARALPLRLWSVAMTGVCTRTGPSRRLAMSGFVCLRSAQDIADAVDTAWAVKVRAAAAHRNGLQGIGVPSARSTSALLARFSMTEQKILARHITESFLAGSFLAGPPRVCGLSLRVVFARGARRQTPSGTASWSARVLSRFGNATLWRLMFWRMWRRLGFMVRSPCTCQTGHYFAHVC